MRKTFYTSAILLIIFLLIIQGEKSLNYAREAIYLCTDMIIPSLFPFFICSGILIYSGFCQKLALISAPVMKPLFNVNANGSSAFILGIISGYPLGAVTACELYKSGYLSKSETERLLAFCNNSGPLFILGSVGVGLYAGLNTGIILYISHIIGSILVGMCMRFHESNKHTAPDMKISSEERSFSEIYRISAVNAANSMMLIGSTILFFSVSSRLVLDLIPFEIPPFIYGIFEFSGGNVFIANSGYPIPVKLIMSSVITGFAGLSVHMQVLAVCSGNGLSMAPYISGKLMHGLFSGAITCGLLWLSGELPSAGNLMFSHGNSFFMAGIYSVLCLLIISVITAIIRLSEKTKRNELNIS